MNSSAKAIGPFMIKALLAIASVACLSACQHSKPSPMPPPTETQIADFGDENGDNQSKRAAWIENMHRTAPGADWKAIEHRTALANAAKFQISRASGCSPEVNIEENIVTATWSERGSIDQAGSVIQADYDPASEMIYTISAGGTIWKGHIAGNSWEVVNQDFRFANKALRLVNGPEGLRIVSAINGTPHYSDDDGLSWIAASGVVIQNASQAQFKNIVLVEENGSQVLYAYGKPDYWANNIFYKSTDLGETWSNMHTFGSNKDDRISLIKPNHSHSIFVLENTTGLSGNLLEWNPIAESFILHPLSETIQLSASKAFLVGSWIDDHYVFYTLNWDLHLEKTEDFFETYETQNGALEDSPWSVGLFQSSSDDELILAGAVNLAKSKNGGASFNDQNNWSEYYGDVFGKLHADIMYLGEFQKADGTPFILISNHGGMSISYDGMESTQNLSIAFLNVAQYYSVRTDPTDSRYVYAGSQDQGFQRSQFSQSGDPGPETFEQVISGDYGHIVFTNSGQGLWTVYPGGWVTYYNNPKFSGISATFEVESDDEGNWLPALGVAEGTPDNSIFMAGGNMNGGIGSHLIKLTYENGQILTTQSDTDFKSETGSELTAIGVSTINPDHVYLGTGNGRFLTSTDGGGNFEQSVDFLPDGNYLYGATIYPSRVNAEKVYYGGSGYSNPGVWVSENNGFSFSPMIEGLPETLVYGLAGTPNDEYLFAATESGPYVYVSSEATWKPLLGNCVPSQTYWSVEYVEELETVRFGTYGRGIWDLKLEYIVTSLDAQKESLSLKIYPNPSQHHFSLNTKNFSSIRSAELFNATGKAVRQFSKKELREAINIETLAAGQYYLRVATSEGVTSLPIVKIN